MNRYPNILKSAREHPFRIGVEDCLALAGKPLTVSDISLMGNWGFKDSSEVAKSLRKLVAEGLVVRHPPVYVESKLSAVPLMKVPPKYEIHEWAAKELDDWHRQKELEWEEREEESRRRVEERERDVAELFAPIDVGCDNCGAPRKHGYRFCKDCSVGEYTIALEEDEAHRRRVLR